MYSNRFNELKTPRNYIFQKIDQQEMPPRKKSTKKAANTPPAHFITDPRMLNDLPDIIPFLELSELNLEARRFDETIAEHVEWLRQQRDICNEIGQQYGIRLPNSRNSAFRLLEDYTVAVVKEEPVDHEMQPETAENDVSSKQATVKEQKKNIGQKEVGEEPAEMMATPRSRPLLRPSQIKPELTSPETQPPTVPSPLKTRPITATRTPCRTRDDAIKKEKEAISLQKKLEKLESRTMAKMPSRPLRDNRPILKAKPDKKEDESLESKLARAAQRRKEQQEEKREKVKKELEINELRVKENKEKQRQEDLKKAEERRQLALRAEEIRKQNATRSPSRSRIVSAAATPTRVKSPSRVKSPARLVVMTGQSLPRFKLFDDSPSSIRTPERPHSKQPRMEQLLSAVRSSPAHPSPIRQVVRKVPSSTRKETIKPPKTERKLVEHSDDAVDAKFMEEQLNLLLKQDLEEKKRRNDEEAKAREEARRHQEEKIRRLEEERQREEQERRRVEEEERLRMEQEQRAAAVPAAIEVEKLNFDISMREDSEEDGGSDVDAYEMTQDKIFIPSTAENYHIEDLDSGDETDDECAPRKKVPEWAQWENLYKAATEQYRNQHVDYDDMFGSMDNPHNQPIFNSTKTKRRPRGSSAHWNSPASNPTKGKSRFLGY